MREEYILPIIKSFPEGNYKKKGDDYVFELGTDGKCIIMLTHEALEFKIATVKWIPGSYEPIEGRELYKRIEFNALDGLSEGEKIREISLMIQRILKED